MTLLTNQLERLDTYDRAIRRSAWQKLRLLGLKVTVERVISLRHIKKIMIHLRMLVRYTYLSGVIKTQKNTTNVLYTLAKQVS